MLRTFSTDTRANKVGERTYRFILSNETVDRHESIVKADGWMLDNYARNGVVAYQHNTNNSDPDMIVGKGRAWMEGTTLMGEVELEPEGDNPIADKLAKKLDFGSIKAVSVGFNPLEWSFGDRSVGEDASKMYFRKQDLLEWSIVNIPSNPDAVATKAMQDFIEMAKDDKKEEVIAVEEPKAPDEYRTRLLKLRINTL